MTGQPGLIRDILVAHPAGRLRRSRLQSCKRSRGEAAQPGLRGGANRPWFALLRTKSRAVRPEPFTKLRTGYAA